MKILEDTAVLPWILFLISISNVTSEGRCFREKNMYILSREYPQCQEIHLVTCSGITNQRFEIIKLNDEKSFVKKNPRACVHFNIVNSNIPLIDDKMFLVDFADSVTQLTLNSDLTRTITDRAFRSFKNLRKLIIFNNNLTNVNFLSELEDLQQVILSNNSIDGVKYDDFVKLRALSKLDLSYNSFEKIRNNFFGPFGLRELDLSHNKITVLEAGAFKDTKRLVILKLSSNRLLKVSNATFDGLEKLEELYLDDNFLNEIENSTFKNLKNLRLLQLNNNRVTTIARDTFKGLNNLKNLYLKNNLIKAIKGNSFSDLNKLTFLEIRGNEINVVANQTFDGLSNIVFINLTNLNIQKVEAGGFYGLSSLKVLDLSNNKIESLRNYTFSKLANLKELYLINNTIRVIEPNGFEDLKNLEVLNIDGNGDISILQADTFNGLSSLTTLAIMDLNIKEIKAGAFNGLNNLNVLFLGNYSPSGGIELRNGTFQGMATLETLNLHNFNISKIEIGAFRDLNNLKKLNLDNCAINELNSGIFSDLNYNIWYIKSYSNEDKFPSHLMGYWYDFGNLSIKNIEEEALTDLFGKSEAFRRDNLYLNYNSIELLRNNTFAGISNLVELALDYDGLEVIESGAFNGLKFHTHPCYSLLKLINRKLTETQMCNALYLNNNKLKIIKDYTFDNLRNLVVLRLDHNLIEDIQSEAFGELYFNLESYTQKFNALLLNNNKLKILRKNLFSKVRNLVTLRLDNNEIEEIEPYAFKDFHFNTKPCLGSNQDFYYNALFLNNNQLKSLSNNTFNGIKFIVSLYLNDNNINSIQPGAFTNLSFSSKLCTTTDSHLNVAINNILDLHNNNLTIIQGITFLGISNLTELRLENNKINKIESDAFFSLNELLMLNLGNNQLNHLEDNLFNNLHSLQILQINNNQLLTLNSQTFTGLFNLKHLLLYSNNILEILLGTFKHFPLLEDLQLGTNNLTSFKTGIFTNLERLKYLNVSRNNFAFINETIFHPLHNLQVLDLDDNHLTYMDFNLLLFHLSKLQFISINNNNWNCPLLTHMMKELRLKQINYLFNASLKYTEENIDGIACSEMDDYGSASNSEEDTYKTLIKESIDEFRSSQNSSTLNMLSIMKGISEKFDKLNPLEDLDKKLDDWTVQISRLLKDIQANNTEEERIKKLFKSSYDERAFNLSPILIVTLLLCVSSVIICVVITVKICSAYLRRSKASYTRAISLMELIDDAT